MTGTKKTITLLWVEDDFEVIEMYSVAFHHEGWRVIHTDDACRARKLAMEEKPDIILLDIILPGMDGREILGILKGDERTKEIPVMILTNLSEVRGIGGKGFEISDYLTKVAFQPVELVRKIKKRIHDTKGSSKALVIPVGIF